MSRYYRPYNDELRAGVKTCITPDGQMYQSNARRWLNIVMSDKRSEIFPNVEQSSIDFKLKKVRTFTKYADMFKQVQGNVDVLNFANGLVDWTSLYDVVPLPSIDCRLTREELGLKDPSEEYIEAYTWLLEACYKNGTWRSVHVNKKSQSGAPFFIKDKMYRTLMALHAIENVEHLTELLLKGDYDSTQEIFHVLPLFTDGIRVQADNVKYEDRQHISTKTRSFPSLEYLRSDGKSGGMIDYTAKTEFIEGVPLFQVRTRKMYGFSSPFNHVLATMHNYLYEGYKNVVRIAQYNGPKSVVDRLKKLVSSIGDETVNLKNLKLLALDKASFDLTMSPILNDLEERMIQTYFKEPLSTLYRISMRAPTIIRSHQKGVKDVLVTKELLPGRELINEENFSSLQSGHAFVSLKGKWKGVGDICDKIIRFMRDAEYGDYNMHKRFRESRYLEIFKTIVSDQLPGVTVFTFGDDTLVASMIPGWIDDFEKFCRSDTNKVHDDQVEDFPVFLGYYYNADLSVHKNIGKLIESLNGDERGWRSKTHPELGAYAKIEEYKAVGNPYVDDVLRLEIAAYNDLGFDLQSYIERGQYALALSTIDMEFLNKPEVIHYKYDADQISGELLKAEFDTIDKDFISFNFNKYLEV